MALGRSRVIGEHVTNVAGLPSGIGDGMPRVGNFELGQLFVVAVHDLGEAT